MCATCVWPCCVCSRRVPRPNGGAARESREPVPRSRGAGLSHRRQRRGAEERAVPSWSRARLHLWPAAVRHRQSNSCSYVLSNRTVRAHRTHIHRKLSGMSSRSDINLWMTGKKTYISA